MSPETAANAVSSHYVEATRRPLTKEARGWLAAYFRDGINAAGEGVAALLEGEAGPRLIDDLGARIKRPKMRAFIVAAAEAYGEAVDDELASQELGEEVIRASEPILSALKTRLCTRSRPRADR